MDEAERCARVGYIYCRTCWRRTPQELKELPGVTPPGTHWLEIAAATSALAGAAWRDRPGVRQATVFGQSVHALTAATSARRTSALGAAQVHVTEPSLEDVFVALSARPGQWE